MSVSLQELKAALKKLALKDAPVIAHASLKSFGAIDGGAPALVQALLESTRALIMPVHTYATMLTPREGPENNGIDYSRHQDANLMAEFFSADMPADKMMGRVPETLRNHPKAKRSAHPILSFAGVNADKILESQTIEEPLAPIRILAEQGGWVLLLGVDHSVNTSIHYAEKFAGRKQFTRWALTGQGVIECPGFPGCSAGFDGLAKDLGGVTKTVQAGQAWVRAIYLPVLLSTAVAKIKKDRRALLCPSIDCERCNQIRKTPVL